MEIKDELMEIKTKTGCPARHLAELANVTSATIWNWLRGKGKPDADQMDIIRAFFKDSQPSSEAPNEKDTRTPNRDWHTNCP